jgi:hypothetical protein
MMTHAVVNGEIVSQYELEEIFQDLSIMFFCC